MTALITLAFGILIVGENTPYDWLVWPFWIVWPTLLLTSIAFWSQRRTLAVVGLLSALLTGFYACMPVIAE
jgi:hypothetical protein